MKIKKGDKIKVIAGKDKGKSGTVIVAYPKMEKVTIEGINMKKKHIKPKGDVKGTTISKEFPIHVSNVKKEE